MAKTQRVMAEERRATREAQSKVIAGVRAEGEGSRWTGNGAVVPGGADSNSIQAKVVRDAEAREKATGEFIQKVKSGLKGVGRIFTGK